MEEVGDPDEGEESGLGMIVPEVGVGCKLSLLKRLLPMGICCRKWTKTLSLAKRVSNLAFISSTSCLSSCNCEPFLGLN